MGFHVIIKAENGQLDSHYADSLEKLADFSDIAADSIIYQGESDWKPVILGTDDRYKHLAEDWFRAGVKAQRLFRRQAIDHGLMIEDLSQDVESFKGYTTNANIPIKRGDFLIRNAKNKEVDTKCKTFYTNENEDCFYIEYADVKKHQNMESFTGCSVILAIYKRCGDTPVEDSLCMIQIQTIVDENNKRVKYDEKTKCFIVPISLTKPNFTLIDQVRAEISL